MYSLRADRVASQWPVLVDLYSDNPDCRGVSLAAYRVDGDVTRVERTPDGRAQIRARRPVGHLPDLYCPLVIHLPDGVVSFPEDHEQMEIHAEAGYKAGDGLVP